jgi:hypothetical protein
MWRSKLQWRLTVQDGRGMKDRKFLESNVLIADPTPTSIIITCTPVGLLRECLSNTNTRAQSWWFELKKDLLYFPWCGHPRAFFNKLC